MKELGEIKGLVDAARDGQLEARNEFVKRFQALGFIKYKTHNFPHPTEEGKKVSVDFQDCYGEGNEFFGFWGVDVRWTTPHECNDACPYNCEEEEDRHQRPATAEEVVEVLRRALVARLEEEEAELRRDWELAKALPTPEELAKIRRKVEDHLRKNPKDIPAVAKLLKVL